MPTPVKVKRSQVQTFLDVAPGSTASYKLIGDGVKSAKINYNPKTSEETYIHEDSGTISVESYAPTMPVQQTCKKGDEVFDFIDDMRKNRKTLTEAETHIVNVWLYETAVAGAYPAEEQKVSIQIEDFGGDGGVSNEINYTINYMGDPTIGTFNPTTATFSD